MTINELRRRGDKNIRNLRHLAHYTRPQPLTLIIDILFLVVETQFVTNELNHSLLIKSIFVNRNLITSLSSEDIVAHVISSLIFLQTITTKYLVWILGSTCNYWYCALFLFLVLVLSFYWVKKGMINFLAYLLFNYSLAACLD